jgi:hypothetical protein
MATYQAERPRIFGPGVLIGGGIAGVLAAILMGLAGSAYIAAIGGGWSTAMQAIAGTYYKSLAFLGGPGVTTVGVLTHLATGGAFGVLLAALTIKMKSNWGLFGLGILYGICVWAFMTFVILPVFDWVMYPRVEMMATMWFFLHWTYGGFAGLFIPPLRNAFSRRAGMQPVPRQQAA